MSKIFTIAEIAQAHDGSLGIAHSYIDALAGTGVDAIKFQTHIAEAESSKFESFRVKFSYEDNSRFDYWKRMEFTREQWSGLKEHCDDVRLEFMSSPFSIAAVNLLEGIGVKRYKVGSGEVNNLLLLHRIAETKKPVILSSGLSSYLELKVAVNFFKELKIPITLLQCTTAYPTQPEEWGLTMLSDLRERFNIPVGFSDHSGDIVAGLAATALGAQVVEFHCVFSRQIFGPDAKASLTIDQAKTLVQGIRAIERSFNKPMTKEVVQPELKNMFGKALAVNRAMKKGEVISILDLETKKPADKGIAAADFKAVIGRMLKEDIPANSFLTSKAIL